MNTIQENEIDAIQRAVQAVNPFLAQAVRKIFTNGMFSPPPIGREQTIYKTFTPSAPVPSDEAKAVLDALEIFSTTPTGRDARFGDGMTIHGLIASWQRFTA